MRFLVEYIDPTTGRVRLGTEGRFFCDYRSVHNMFRCAHLRLRKGNYPAGQYRVVVKDGRLRRPGRGDVMMVWEEWRRAFVHTLAVGICWVLAFLAFNVGMILRASVDPWTPIPATTVVEGGK